MKMIIEKDRKTKISYLKAYLYCGSSFDPKEKEGLSYLTFRALLWGTKNKNQKTLNQEIERLGASISSGVGFDRSVVSLSVIDENFKPAFELFKEILFEPRFDDESVSKIKELLKGEIRSQLADPKYQTTRSMMKSLLAGSPYEKSGEGTIDSIDRIQASDLKGFYQKHFFLENFFFSMVGKEDFLDEKDFISASFEKMKKGTVQLHSGPDLNFNGRRALVVQKENLSTTPIYITLPGFLESDKDRVALEIGNFIFGGDFTARLIQVLRAKNGWTYGASSGFGQHFGSKDSKSIFSIYTFPSEEFAHLVLPKTLELLEEYVEKGISDEEFSFAQNSIANGYALRIDSAQKRLSWKIREFVYGRKYLSLDDFQKTIRKLSRDEVNRVIKERFDLSNILVATIGNSKVLKKCIESVPGFCQAEVIEHV